MSLSLRPAGRSTARPSTSPSSASRGRSGTRGRRSAILAALFSTPLLALACGESGGREASEADAAAGVTLAPDVEALPEGTRRMAERLAALEDPGEYGSRVAEMRAMEPPSDPRAALAYHLSLARFQLLAGCPGDALATLERLRELAAGDVARVPSAFLHEVVQLSAISSLWLGFDRNCIHGPTPRCLFPTPPEGVWPDPVGVPRAIREYELLLEQRPDDLLSRWLLNLAHMFQGTYPGSVPSRWRFPPSTFRDEARLTPFPELAGELGLDVMGHAGGAVMEDFDGDGDLDLMASGQGLRDSLRYFRSEGNGRFTERTRQAGLTGLVGGLNLLHADYDNDGDADVLVLRGAWSRDGQPNSLLRNEGDGTFVDVTEAAGLLPVHPTQTASWGDYDGDGDLDLFVGNETQPDGPIHPSQLYRNEGDGTFTDVAAEVGLDLVGFVKSLVWGDFDNDGDPDLYVSRLDEANGLYRNDGPGPDGRWRFTDVAERAGVDGPLESFVTWFFDYDNDGWLDIFVSGYRLAPRDIAAEYLGELDRAALPRLYRNRGDGTFRDVTREAGLRRVLYTMGSNFGDLDNDGWLDAYIGTGAPDFRAMVPNRMFRNAEGRFQEVTTSGGFGHLGKGHGVAFGDLDGDGDQDLYVVMGGAEEGDVARNLLWENPGFGNAWVTLRLEGREANRSAIGARVRVRAETAEGGTREVHHLVGTGGSFGSSSLQAEIGLGDARAIREVEIRWPGSGRRDLYRDLALDRVYRIHEGAAAPEEVAVRRFGLTR